MATLSGTVSPCVFAKDLGCSPRKLQNSRLAGAKLLHKAFVTSSSRSASTRRCVRVRAALATAVPEGWTKFSSLVSGEWEGYASDFLPDGSPVSLPQEAVPQAFRDWGLSLFAWQSHSSTDASADGSIFCKTLRFFPAVACDSLDAPVYSQQVETFGISRDDTGMVAFRQDGSFAVARPGRSVLRAGALNQSSRAVLREEVQSELKFELEHCLVAQDPQGTGRARVRVLQQFERDSIKAVPRLTGLTLFRERWTGDYGGSTSSDSSTSFAEGPPVTMDAVEGRWLASKMVAKVPQEATLGPRGTIVEMQPGGAEEVTRQLTEEGAVFLPQGVWSRVLPTPSGGLILKAGWLVDENRAIVSRFDFSSAGQLEDIIISTETRLSKEI